MGIIADKKDGKTTGRWRVELQRGGKGEGGQRYRKRHDSHAGAMADEKRVLALWGAGEAAGAPQAARAAPSAPTLKTLREEAYGTLWEGSPQEGVNWAQVDLVIAFLGADVRLDKIDTLTIDRVIKHLKSAGKADATVNRYLSHFRKALTWGKERKLLTTPLSDIKFEWRKESPGRVRWITVEEEAGLKKHLPVNVWKLVKVAIETGCRRDELLTAEEHQISEGVEEDMLHLWKTKTDDPRSVPMTKETSAILKQLIAGEMPSRMTLRRKWDKAKEAMGLKDDELFVFHVCRHTCATRLADAEVDALAIKAWLGHKRMETTLRYTHVKSSNLTRALQKRGTVYAQAA